MREHCWKCLWRGQRYKTVNHLWGVKRARIQIPLQHDGWTDSLSGYFGVNGPVYSNHIIPKLGYFFESIVSTFGEYYLQNARIVKDESRS